MRRFRPDHFYFVGDLVVDSNAFLKNFKFDRYDYYKMPCAAIYESVKTEERVAKNLMLYYLLLTLMDSYCSDEHQVLINRVFLIIQESLDSKFGACPDYLECNDEIDKFFDLMSAVAKLSPYRIEYAVDV